MELCFYGGPRASLTNTSGCCSTTFQSLQLSPYSQQQSSPWVCPLNPEFRHQAPTHTSSCTSQAGGTRCWHGLSAQIFLCSARHKELLCSPLILWYFFSVLPDLHTSEGAFQAVNFSSFSAPFQGHRSHPASTFIFFLLSHQVTERPFLSFQVCEVFCWYSVHVLWEFFFLKMYLWCIYGRRWVSCPAILPSWLDPLYGLFLKIKSTFQRQRFSFHLQPRWTNRDWITLSPSVWGIFLSQSPTREGRG